MNHSVKVTLIGGQERQYHCDIECDMYLICNAGFVTIGFWYHKEKIWRDGNHKVNITNQVTHWMPMPEAPY